MLLLMLATTTAKKSSSSAGFFLVLIALYAAFYFFYFRPRSKKQKAARQQARQVEVGERAQTVGGFVGTVIRRDDRLVTMRTDAGVELDFIPSAIARRFDPVPESTDDDADAATHDVPDEDEPTTGDASEGDK